MYTILRVGKNWDGSPVFAVADWSDATIDSLTSKELEECIKLGFQIEGICKGNTGKYTISKEVPRVSGSDELEVVDDAKSLGLNVTMLRSYSYLYDKNRVSVAFHVDGNNLYEDGNFRNVVLRNIPVEQNFKVPVYDRQLKKMVERRVFTDYIQITGMELLKTSSKNPLFKLSASSIDKHFYGEDKEEYFYKDYVLELRKDKKFYFVGNSPWRHMDGSEYLKVDASNKRIILKGSGRVVYHWM